MDIVTEIIINASAEKVWEILTDTDHYPNWNPFIKKIVGIPCHGKELQVTMQAPGGRPLILYPRVLKVEEAKELRWRGSLFFQGIFDGEHIFQIVSLSPNKVRFIHREHFSGLMAPFLKKAMHRAKEGFVQMNQALKQLAEAPTLML